MLKPLSHIADNAFAYYPFGMVMFGRFYSANSGYRFGFNGKEDDNENNLQDYGKRMYNKRLGRFISVDPIARKYPELSTYQFASDRPIDGTDMDGLEFSKSKGVFSTIYVGSIFETKEQFMDDNSVQDKYNPNPKIQPEYYNFLKVNDEKSLRKAVDDHHMTETQISPLEDGKVSTLKEFGISKTIEMVAENSPEYKAYEEVQDQAKDFIQAKVLVNEAFNQNLIPKQFENNGQFYSDLINNVFDGTLASGSGAKLQTYNKVITLLGQEIYNNRDEIGAKTYSRPATIIRVNPPHNEGTTGMYSKPSYIPVANQTDLDAAVSDFNKTTDGCVGCATIKQGGGN